MKVDRLLSIIMILLEKKRIGAQALADMFEVSRRTIYRDIEAIAMAGVPVRATSGVGGGFEMMEQYKLDKRILSASDLSAILTGLSGLSSVTRENELVNALARVKSFIPAESAKAIELRAHQIDIDLSPWIGNPSIPRHLEIIKAALRENRLLSFEYMDHSGNKTVRTAEPYQLVLKNSHWYWLGYCYKRQAFRLFKLTRVSNLQMTRDTFTPRAYEKPRLDFTQTDAATPITLKLRLHRSVMDRALDYCAYEAFTPDGGEYYLVDFPFVENDYNYDFLLGFGSRCQCLAPPHVRAEMRRRTRAMAQLYEG